MRVSLFTGGKDSLYASMLAGSVDAYVMFIYEFPNPSPHQVNLKASVMTGLATGRPVLIKRLRKGREFEESVEFLRLLGVNELIAGDVYVEEHLKYVEGLARESGASLKEPLWGMDPEEVLRREVEAGIEAYITGVIKGLEDILGLCICGETVNNLISRLRRGNIDPLGELGEYHTVVTNSPIHERRLTIKVIGRLVTGRGSILEVLTH